MSINRYARRPGGTPPSVVNLSPEQLKRKDELESKIRKLDLHAKILTARGDMRGAALLRCKSDETKRLLRAFGVVFVKRE